MTTRKRASKGEVLPLTFEQRTIRRLTARVRAAARFRSNGGAR